MTTLTAPPLPVFFDLYKRSTLPQMPLPSCGMLEVSASLPPTPPSLCLSECWQREAYCLPVPQYTGETCLQAQSRAESTQSAEPQASGYASRTGAYRDQAKGSRGPLLPGHYSSHIHICAKNWPSPYLAEWIWC